MTDLVPIECEARLVGLSKQRRKDGDWIEVKFHIHPDDHPAALFILPLGTACNLAIKGTEEAASQTANADSAAPTANSSADDETPKLKGGPICKRAVMLCKRPEFQTWASLCGLKTGPNSVDFIPQTEDGAREFIHRKCNITTRALLDHSAEAAKAFENIEYRFRLSQQGRTESALLDQRERRG